MRPITDDISKNTLKIKSGEFPIVQKFDVNISENNNYRLLFFNEIPTNTDKKD